jgi:NDP-sugar pyrophosphorylase family protein
LGLDVKDTNSPDISSFNLTSFSIARVLGNTIIGNHCVIGAACSTEMNETIDDMVVIYGNQPSRRTQSTILPVCKKKSKVT